MFILQNFSKSFSGLLVLSVPALNLAPGVHWIKGENGSGKTTLFRSLAGMLPHEGEVYFDDGISLKKNPVNYRRLVNYSEAEPLYPGFLTAKDLIRFIGKAKSASIDQQEKIAKRFGVDAFLNNSCETYSSGMLKKLSLTLAFLGAPRLIILDEPLITLDEQARNILFEMIDEYVRNHNTTFLLSSHQLLERSAVTISQSFEIQNKTLIPA